VGFTYNEDGPAVELFESGTKLGIAHRLLKHAFVYSIKRYHVLRALQDQGTESGLEAELIRVMRPILIVKGDMPSVLNVRKRMLSLRVLDYNEELQFMDVIMTLHPKSPSLWEHRRLLVKAILAQVGAVDGAASSLLVAKEAEISSRLCAQYPRNYYGWNHRLWLLEAGLGDINFLSKECSAMREWIKRHPSDHSACSYFHQLATTLLKCLSRQDLREQIRPKWSSILDACSEDPSHHTFAATSTITAFLFLLSVLEENEKTIAFFSESQTPWYHRRSIWQLILQTAQLSFVASPPDPQQEWSSLPRNENFMMGDVGVHASALPKHAMGGALAIVVWIDILLQREAAFITAVYGNTEKKGSSNASKFLEFVGFHFAKFVRQEVPDYHTVFEIQDLMPGLALSPVFRHFRGTA